MIGRTMTDIEAFTPFPKIKRISRDMVITEKLDGTNASISIGEDGSILAGSRTRWITPENDNYGFARWVEDNRQDLLKLGPGHHFGEWWGKGIQRGYNQIQKRFSLFNVSKWEDPNVRPTCCDVVPVMCRSTFDTAVIDVCLQKLKTEGSLAAPGYPYPEGIIIFHTASNYLFKKTIENDDKHKFE